MKKFLGLIFCVFSLFGLSGKIPRTTPDLFIVRISPFYIGQESYFYISVVHDSFSKNDLLINVSIENDLYSEGKTIFDLVHRVDDKTKYYNLTYDNRYTRLDNTIVMTTEYNGVKNSYSVDVPLGEYNAYQIGQNNSIIETEGDLKSFRNKTWGVSNSLYEFIGFDGLLMNDFTNKVDLSCLEIATNCAFARLFNDCYLFIENVDGIFNDMPVEDDYLCIPLTYYLDGETFKLSLKNTYFVNPRTFAMSKDYKDGYLETNYLYLPNAKLSKQLSGMIIFEDFGINHSYVFNTFDIEISGSIFGDCVTSEYCIVASNSEINDEIGWNL